MDRFVLKNIFLPTVLTALLTIIFSMFEYGIGFIVFSVITLLFELIFQFNYTYLIELDGSQSGRIIEVTYYNFLDKIKKEELKMEEIVKLERNKKNTRTTIELKNHRLLVLRHINDL